MKRTYISSTPDIMGGALVIKGTRVPMERILYMISEGNTIEEVHQHYPWVSKETFKGAIAELAMKMDKILPARMDNSGDAGKVLQT